MTKYQRFNKISKDLKNNPNKFGQYLKKHILLPSIK